MAFIYHEKHHLSVSKMEPCVSFSLVVLIIMTLIFCRYCSCSFIDTVLLLSKIIPTQMHTHTHTHLRSYTSFTVIHCML